MIPLVGDENTLIEFSHRLIAGIVVGLIALLCWRAYRELERPAVGARGTMAAGALVLIQAGLGGLTVEHSLDDELVAAHLGLAMLLLGLLLWLGAKARSEGPEIAERDPRRPAPQVRGLKPFAAVAVILLLGAIVAGGYMAGTEKEGVHEAGSTSRGPISPAESSSRSAATAASCPSGRTGSPTSTSPTARWSTERRSRSSPCSPSPSSAAREIDGWRSPAGSW